MKDRYFIDTNILVYSFDNENSHKRNIALKLISVLKDKPKPKLPGVVPAKQGPKSSDAIMF